MSTLIMLVCVGTPVEFAADVVFSDGTLGIGVGDVVAGEYELVDDSLILSFEIDGKLSFSTDLDRSEICQMSVCRAWGDEPIAMGADNYANALGLRNEPDAIHWYWLNAAQTESTLGFAADVTMLGGIPEPATGIILAEAIVLLLLFFRWRQP